MREGLGIGIVSEAEARERALPARTRDGHAVAIGANVNNPEQVGFALDQGLGDQRPAQNGEKGEKVRWWW